MEYKIIAGARMSVEAEINKMAADGWRLHTYFEHVTESVAVLERQASDRSGHRTR